MSDDESILVCASLLHDIGKIENRTNIRTSHEELGFQFLKDNLIVADKRLLDLVKYHHTDRNYLPYELKNDDNFIMLLEILKNADNLAASHDRDDKIKEDEVIKKLKKIFMEIESEGDQKKDDEYFPPYTLRRFFEKLESDDGSIFNFKGEGTSEYNGIYKEIKDYFSKFDLIDLSYNLKKINTLNSILMATTRFIPSAFYYSEPNVPLYDHLKMTAAISQILYRLRNSNEKKILLIYGDIIGVQNYIFRYFKSGSTDDKGTKRLRGRSLMIKLINDSVINYILDELNLYQFNVLFDSSDKFFILCDYSQENVNKLLKLRENVEKFLYNEFRDINISLVWKENSIEILNSNELNKFIQDVIDEAGKRKYKLLDSQGFGTDFFILNREINKLCDKCGLRPAKDDGICDMCKLEEDIGQKIVKVDNIYRTDVQISDVYVKFEYGDKKYFYNFDASKLDKCNHLEIISINNFEYIESLDKLNSYGNMTLSWRFILQGNYIPKVNNRTKTINDLVCYNVISEKRSCSYLAISKGDMDNMGTILKKGFISRRSQKDEKNYNFTKYSAFSFYTNIFFTLILNKIAKSYDIYIAYSGGDDLVAIGEINQMLLFLKELNIRFREWFSNPHLTISVGVAMFDASYPLWKGINIAEEELKRSKVGEKNSITVFDNTMKWGHMVDDEFERYIDLSEKITKSIKNNSVAKRFNYFLLELSKYTPNRRINSRSIVRVMIPDPYLSYYLKRNWKSEDYAERDKLMDDILKNFDHISFSAIYSILKLRKEELEKESMEVK
ncbi:MAG: type III-A CRISPR-associated protein Cas10/Csm1 [Thermoplasmata archaeon]